MDYRLEKVFERVATRLPPEHAGILLSKKKVLLNSLRKGLEEERVWIDREEGGSKNGSSHSRQPHCKKHMEVKIIPLKYFVTYSVIYLNYRCQGMCTHLG